MFMTNKCLLNLVDTENLITSIIIFHEFNENCMKKVKMSFVNINCNTAFKCNFKIFLKHILF